MALITGKTASPVPLRGALIQVDHALESSRESGFNLSAAAGEPVDNSIEAGASIIRIAALRQRVDKHERIDKIIFSDNGAGIPRPTLPHVLTLGFSTRYNNRKGLGRFGMGLKLAALSQGKRVDVYTKPTGSSKIYHVFVDLELVTAHEQEWIELTTLKQMPREYQDLFSDPVTKKPFESGTVVVWSKIDRLVTGGKFGSPINEHTQDLKKFLARAYRKFIDKGLYIEFDGRQITLHDPTFQLLNPRVVAKFKEDLRATEIDSHDIEIDGHNVHAVVTLLPERFRLTRNVGGRTEELKDLYIPDNDGAISILRNGREIYYDLVPKLYPGGVDRGGLDRFIGVEVSFPAALDEYFQVRNVKRGAEPVSHLREELRAFLRKPIKYARNEIRRVWTATDVELINGTHAHRTPEEIANRVDQSAPRGRAGMNLSDEQTDRKITEVLKAAGHSEATSRGKEIKDAIKQYAITVLDNHWPGKDLFTIAHLNNKSIVTLNHDHPFVREVCDAAKELRQKEASDSFGADGVEKVRRIADGLDLLIMAYAKAENMHDKPDETYGSLRLYWGMFIDSYMRDLIRPSNGS